MTELIMTALYAAKTFLLLQNNDDFDMIMCEFRIMPQSLLSNLTKNVIYVILSLNNAFCGNLSQNIYFGKNLNYPKYKLSMRVG